MLCTQRVLSFDPDGLHMVMATSMISSSIIHAIFQCYQCVAPYHLWSQGMEAVNTDDQPKNSVKQMRKISEFLCASSFLEKSVSVMCIMLASDQNG